MSPTSPKLVIYLVLAFLLAIFLIPILIRPHKKGELFTELVNVCENTVIDHYNHSFVLVGKVLVPITSPVHRCEKYQCYRRKYLQGTIFTKLVEESKENIKNCEEN
jgi:hypothetical protein